VVTREGVVAAPVVVSEGVVVSVWAGDCG